MKVFHVQDHVKEWQQQKQLMLLVSTDLIIYLIVYYLPFFYIFHQHKEELKRKDLDVLERREPEVEKQHQVKVFVKINDNFSTITFYFFLNS